MKKELKKKVIKKLNKSVKKKAGVEVDFSELDRTIDSIEKDFKEKEELTAKTIQTKVYWLVSADPNKQYEDSTWYKSPGIEKFVKLLTKEASIVAITFEGDDIGFIVERKIEIPV